MMRAGRTLAFVLVTLLLVFMTSVVRGEPIPLNADERHYPPLPPLAAAGEESRDRPPESREPDTPAALIPWSRLVYYARGQGNWDLYFSDDYGQDARRLTSAPTMEVQPDLSRGGALVVYASDADGDFDLYIMNLGSGQSYKLLETPADEYHPVWSPDGRYVAFESDRDGQNEVYVVNGNGQNLKRLTTNPDFDGHPSWSPDGMRLAYSSRRDGQYRIWVMNADGSGQTRLSNQPGSLYPAWSPDGNDIAYSADGDNNGWLDVWLMTATGENQRALAGGGPGVDLEARSWAPDASAVTYTRIAYIQYQGEWYISDTSLMQRRFEDHFNRQFAVTPEYPFGPAWQTLDTAPPVSAIQSLPAVSPANLVIRWSAADAGGAGLRVTTIELKIDNGPWTEWVKNPAAPQLTYRGVGGKAYAFRIRAIDQAFNTESWPAAPDVVTTVEKLPPRTEMEPLPPFSRAGRSFIVNWSGTDPGGSGIAHYQVQTRRGNGAWNDWLAETGDTSAVFDPVASGIAGGETVAFRVRAVDAAQNVELWRADPGDAATTVYTWGVTGRLIDNTGTPVGEAAITTTPATLGPTLSGRDGEFGRYLGSTAGTVTLGWTKNGYGALPPTAFATTADAMIAAALPPADDAVAGGDFEGAEWGAWNGGGSLGPVMTAAARHTGAQGAQLAARPPQFAAAQPLTADPQENDFGPQLSVFNGDTTLLWASGYFDGPSVLWAARRLPSGDWSPPQQVLDGIRYGYDMVTGSDGQIHVVARRDAGLNYTRRNADGTWTSAELIAGTFVGYELKLYRGPDNALHLFWRQMDAAITELRYSRRAPAGGWSAPISVVTAHNPDNLYYYGAAITPQGAIHLVYSLVSSEESIGNRLMAKERRPDGSWSAATTLDSGQRVFLYLEPGIEPVAGPDGKVHFIWQHMLHVVDKFQYEVYYAVKDSTGWNRPEVVWDNGSPAGLALGPDGIPQAVIWTYPSGLGYTTRAGGVWTYPEVVPGEGDATLLAGSDGQTHVIRNPLPDYYSPENNVIYMRRSVSGPWSEPVNVSDNDLHNHTPVAALDPGGNVHIAWLVKKDGYTSNEGDVIYAGPTLAGRADESTLTQAITIPAAAHPVLSFFYRFGGGATPATRLEVTVGDAPAVVVPASPGEMRHHWIDLTGRTGEKTVTFRLVQAAGEPAAWADIDDVSLGAAFGDVWVSARGASAMPATTAVHELVAGNRGGVAAGPVVLTYTLPPELSFVSADPAPQSTSPLRWEFGSLAAGATRPVRVVVAVSPSATVPQTIYATAEVSAAGELETHNNTAAAATRLESVIYLPVVLRY